jgi:adhesin HecA-like repeat protein
VGFASVAHRATMTRVDTHKATALIEGELTKPEQLVWQAARTGTLVDFGGRLAELDDRAEEATWDEAPMVRAELLAMLLVDAPTQPGARRVRAVRLRGARITGHLDLEATTLGCPLLLQDCFLEQPINLKEALAPVVRLPGCHVPGLAADQLETRGNLELNCGFSSSGEVCLVGAHIGGQVDLTGAHLTNPEGPALSADRLTVGQSMLCVTGFKAEAEVRLVGTHIEGTLSFNGARLKNSGGFALVANALTVKQHLLFRDGFMASGEVRMVGAHIGGQLNLDEAWLENPGRFALAADVLTVDQDAFFREGFVAKGEVRMFGAHAGGQLNFRQARLMNPGGRALNLAGVRAAELVLRPRERPDGVIDLTNAHVGGFKDEQATWPDELQLRGFVYDTLEEDDEVGVRARLNWIHRHQGGYTPQLYEQLAAAYRRDGRDEAARRVAVAKQWHRRRVLNPLGKLWNWLLYLTVGYGYRTWLAALWLVGLLIVGTRVFEQASAHMTATKQPAPDFHPVIYTLERLVPILNLGQKDAWIPPEGTALAWSWVLTGAGWVLTTAVVAGLTGVLKRD